MPANDYICAISGKHFRDIVIWRGCEQAHDCRSCPFIDKDLIDTDGIKKVEDYLKSLPPVRLKSKSSNVIIIILKGITSIIGVLLFLGVIFGILVLIRWIISII